MAKKDHKAAVGWFDKAVALLDATPSSESPAEVGRHGETFVSMGVSYWDTGQHDKAVKLTQQGLDLMKQAVEAEPCVNPP